MASIPIAPPPPPRPRSFANTVNSSQTPPPPLRQTTNVSVTISSWQIQPPPSLPEQPLRIETSSATEDTPTTDAETVSDVRDAPTELLASSVSASSPGPETDQIDVPKTTDESVVTSEESSTITTPSPPSTKDEDTSLERINPRAAFMQESEGVLSTSSVTSSPRRPRRAGTGIPENTRVSDLDFEIDEDIGPSARDEFEEEFLNRNAGDKESQMISDVLERVEFRQLSDDEEVLSDDAADSERGETTARRASESAKQTKQRKKDWDFHSMSLGHLQQSTVQSNWRRMPSEVGCRGCEGCVRLCGENRKLRRQLDELEFELASGVFHNPADEFDLPDVVSATPAIPHIPIESRKKKGWTSKLRNATVLSVSSSKPGEKSRLKDEVQALNVTTEYLWRKLSKAENELRNYRLRDLRHRMKMSAAKRPDHDGEEPHGRNVGNIRSQDWEWE